MKDLLEHLVSAIVDKPEAVVIAENPDATTGFTNLEITVDSADMGKVIGKGGKIIKALRDLVRVLAVKQNRRVNVVLRED